MRKSWALFLACAFILTIAFQNCGGDEQAASSGGPDLAVEPDVTADDTADDDQAAALAGQLETISFSPEKR